MSAKNRIIELLQRIGLTKTEAEIFWLCSKNPGLTLPGLAIESGLPRATLYRVYNRLHQLGLLTSSPDPWRKTVSPVSLKAVAEKVAKQQRGLRKIEIELKKTDSMSRFTTLDELLEEPVRIYTDKTQIIDKYFEVLHHDFDHFLAYGSAERLIDLLGPENEKRFVDMRKRKGKSCDVLITELGPYGKEMIEQNAGALRNLKIKEEPGFKTCMTYIYDGEATIIQKDPKLGERALIIKDPLLVKMQETTFNALWR